MNKKGLYILLGALLSLISLYYSDTTKEAKVFKNQDKMLFGTLKKITDGDTLVFRIDHESVRVRLYGIDTPEKFESPKLQRSADNCSVTKENIKAKADLATNYARNLLHIGERYKIEVFEKDRYGRVVGIVYLGTKTSYNVEIVRAGFAGVYSQYVKERFSFYKELLVAQKEAKKARRGLWGVDYRLAKCLFGG